MNLELTDEQTLIIAMVRRFVREEILPLEINIDPDADSLEPEDQARLIGITKSMGLYGLDIPPEYGGPDIDLITRTLIAVEMAQHRAGLYAPCYGAFGGAGLAQLFEATDAQKEAYLYPTLRGEKRGFFGLSEPSGGSDPARAIETKAVRVGDDWTAPILDLFSHGPAKTRVAMASPVLSLIPTPLGFMSGVSCTRFARRTTRPSCSLRTWSCPTATSWARSIRALPLPMTD